MKMTEAIKYELGLTVSIGVSFNKIFAKLGSDMKKPDAVTVIPKESFKEIVWDLPASDMLGIGRAIPTAGEIFYDDKSIAKIDKYTFRSKYIGVVFQSFNLITKYTALENVVLSMDVAGYKTKDKQSRALELLESVGLDEDEANRRVLKLSGGQQQRVAIARALSYDPDIILADEPTGNLDRDTQKEIIEIFRELANQGKCVILVSHSPDVADMCDERYELTKISGRNKKG